MNTEVEPQRHEGAKRRRGLIEDREYDRDCVTQMHMLRSRPDMLANALLDMGVTENGDGIAEGE
jgi:hypothetical protein